MKYRKKPVAVEAVRWDGTNVTEVELFCGGAAGDATYDGAEMRIKTLEGPLRAAVGDYIIKGVQGEFYPVKEDIFQATHEPVEDTEP